LGPVWNSFLWVKFPSFPSLGLGYLDLFCATAIPFPKSLGVHGLFFFSRFWAKVGFNSPLLRAWDPFFLGFSLGVPHLSQVGVAFWREEQFLSGFSPPLRRLFRPSFMGHIRRNYSLRKTQFPWGDKMWLPFDPRRMSGEAYSRYYTRVGSASHTTLVGVYFLLFFCKLRK